ncbi:MAG: hypothetical protein AAF587_07215 [Bacteroidota bacterium]
MKYTLVVLIALMILIPQLSGSAIHRPQAVSVDDICQLYGTFYVEEVAAFANYRVHINDNEAFADLKVYVHDSEIFADRPGHWYETNVKAFADFTIYKEKVEGFADFSVAFTTFRTSAGCN